MNTSSELAVPSAQREFQATVELLLEKIGLFGPGLARSTNQEDQTLFSGVVGKLLQNLYSLKAPARDIAAQMIEKIASRARMPVA